jgi:hypothetical protein
MRYEFIIGATLMGMTNVGCRIADASDAACDIDYAAIKLAEMAEIDSGFSIYKRFVTENLSENDLDHEEIASLERMDVILKSRDRPVDQLDISILESADAKLADELVWDRADNRKCDVEDEIFSLYCSLFFGSMVTIGEYQHRRTAIQEVRFAIEDATGGREFDHRLMDFNNLPETSFDDVKAVIELARDRVQARLESQAKCVSGVDRIVPGMQEY